MSVAVLRANDPNRVGEYELTGRLGEGGQGTVFLGRHLRTGQQVAIKLLHAELTGDERAQSRFVREVGVAQRVAPFCTAQVLEVGVHEDRPFIVSEYVPGPSLHRQVVENGPLTGGALQRVAVGIATALVAIHEAGVVHRDLKPANVLLGPAGARVIDFGISRALDATTHTGGLAGTPVYMAPEQARGEQPEPPMDIFAWGATIVFAATGAPPFGSDTLPAVINRIMNGEPDLGNLEGPLRDVAAACFNKDAARRPQASEVLMALLGGRPVTAPASPSATTSGAYPSSASGAYPSATHAAAPVPQPIPQPFEREEVMSGILEAGRDLAAARTPDGTIPPGPRTLPPAAPEPRPSIYERAQQHYAAPPPPSGPAPAPAPAYVEQQQQQPPQPHPQQQPQPHAMHEYAPPMDAGRGTIDPARTHPPQQHRRQRGRAVAWAVSAAALAALLTGLVLLASNVHWRSGNGTTTGNDSTPTTQVSSTQTSTGDDSGGGDDTSDDTATPSPTQTHDSSGGYVEPTHTPTWSPTPTHTWSPTPTPTPTDTPTPTPTPTDTGSGSGGGYGGGSNSGGGGY